MAAELDVAGRLAEARQAVDNTQSYVWACHLVDYQNPDLTLHSAQVRDWYSSEDGMDLRVLDADCSALQAVAAAADDALRRQREQVTSLAAAWRGDGAASAQDFLRRHADTAENATTAVRTAADAVAGLRDALWAIVDKKVATLSAIDDRRQGERPAWLAAAQTVISGAGDRAAASELLDQQVKPFVDNDIRVDWLTAVRTATASIGSSYDAATAGLTSAPPVQFDVPGDLGPESAPSPRVDDEAAAGDPAPTTRAAAAPSPAPPSPTPPPPSSPAYPIMPAMAPTQMPAAMPAGLGASPATAAPAPTAAPTGLDGLGQRFADALGNLGGLVPSPGDTALPDQPALEPPTLGDPPSDPSAHDDANDEDVDKLGDVDPDGETDCPGSEHKEGEPAPAADVDTGPLPVEPVPPVDPAEPPAPPPAPPAPPAPEAPAPEAGTPCEIAADELPQAGQ